MSKKILRPNFTKNIHQHYIKKGKSLNIFGARGVGKSRFIEDLELLVDRDTHFITLNMRELRTNYKRFVKRLKDKLGIEGDFDTIELVLAQFAKKEGYKVLIIDHFEYLFESNHDKAFNFDFFDQLNSFKNSEDVSLVILSLHNYKHEHFYKDGELTTSPLDISVEEITPLLQKEIEDELKRKIEEDLGFELLASMIMGKDYPYHLIDFIAKEINFGHYNSNDFLERNFDRWDGQLRKNSRVIWYLWLWKHIKKINPKTLMGVLEKVALWFKKKD
jgi:energy-coupling factor transporter ATP-binding protein EcfA2